MGQLALLKKSAQLDSRLLGISRYSVGWRTKFVVRKYATLGRLRKGPTRFDIPPLSLTVRDMSGLGTLQSSIVDFYDDIVASVSLPDCPLIIDVGSNIGQFVNAAKLFYPQAKVVCFEPDPDTFADLRINTRTLSGVELHNVGLGAEDETRTFYRHELSGMSSFSPDADDEAQRRGTSELEVRRLDDLVPPEVRPHLLKIDVEGFERQVLAGGWETVRRSRYLLLELSLGRRDGASNLHLLRDIVAHVPGASVIRFGRPLGEAHNPVCQDVLIMIDDVDRARPSDTSLGRAHPAVVA